MKILVTSGGTKIPIDLVRHIANMSKGTFPSAFSAEGLKNHGWDLMFFHAEGSRNPFEFTFSAKDSETCLKKAEEMTSLYRASSSRYHPVTYKDFDSYASGLEKSIQEFQPDVVVLAAAVSDYGAVPVQGKIRTGGDMSIRLFPLPKIISRVREWAPNAALVGFKLLVNSSDEELIDAAHKSVLSNGCAMVVANDLRDIKNSQHRLLLVRDNKGAPSVEIVSKNIAATLALRITELAVRR